MSGEKFSNYTKIVIKFEDEIKRIRRDTAEDSKKLISFAQNLSSQFEVVSNNVLDQIRNEVLKEVELTLSKLRNSYEEEKNKIINEINDKAKRNLEKAVKFLLDSLEVMFK
jgi:hypothetical protein